MNPLQVIEPHRLLRIRLAEGDVGGGKEPINRSRSQIGFIRLCGVKQPMRRNVCGQLRPNFVRKFRVRPNRQCFLGHKMKWRGRDDDAPGSAGIPACLLLSVSYYRKPAAQGWAALPGDSGGINYSLEGVNKLILLVPPSISTSRAEMSHLPCFFMAVA